MRKNFDDQRADAEENARRADAMRSPEGRWSLDLEGKTEGAILEFVRIHLEREPLTDPAARRAFARAVAATGLLALWRNGNKRDRETQVGASKLKTRARLMEVELGDESRG